MSMEEIITHEISEMTDTEKTIALKALTNVVCMRGEMYFTENNMLRLILTARREFAKAMERRNL